MRNIDGRARGRSEPGLTSFGRALAGLEGGERDRPAGSESRGASRLDQPEGGGWSDVAAAMSAQADDAAGLAAGLGDDVRATVESVRYLPRPGVEVLWDELAEQMAERAGRLARLCLRLCRQVEFLRNHAELCEAAERGRR